MKCLSAYKHPDALVHTWQVHAFVGGMRADQYLVYKIERISRSKAQRIIEQGEFRTSEGPLKPSQRLYGGEHVELWRFPPEEPSSSFDEVRVLYEDADIVVVEKPADLTIHPTARYLYQTLTHWFYQHYPDNPPNPCHRLDRETSGIVVAARSKAAESQIKRAFEQGQVTKIYLAIVRGHMTQPFVANWPLGLQGDRGLVRIRMIRDDVQGQASETHFVPLRYCANTDRTLVECHPKTGRQHQIRAHLAGLGFPIFGDKLYAMGDEFFDSFTKNGITDESTLECNRQALHASSISFELFGKRWDFNSPLPEDLVKLID